jgi:hypothetical protein
MPRNDGEAGRLNPVILQEVAMWVTAADRRRARACGRSARVKLSGWRALTQAFSKSIRS